jgi:hypothetical protein
VTPGWFRLQILVRGGGEFLAAARATEVEGLAGMLEAMPRGERIDRHAADRIDDPFRRVGDGGFGGGAMVMRASVIVVAGLNVGHGGFPVSHPGHVHIG